MRQLAFNKSGVVGNIIILYEVELVIPFSSLRYSLARVQTWRIDFGRGFTLADELTRYVYWTSRMEGIESVSYTHLTLPTKA